MTGKKLLLILALLAVGYFVIRPILITRHLISGPGENSMWIPVNDPIQGTKKLLNKFTISKDTEIPYVIEYPLGSITINEIFTGQDIWTKDNLPRPGVVPKEGDETIRATFGFGLGFDDGEKMRYASFRSVQPDGLYDSKPYKVLGETVLSSKNTSSEKTTTVLQYRLETEAVSMDPKNPILQLNLVTEEVTTGQEKSFIAN